MGWGESAMEICEKANRQRIAATESGRALAERKRMRRRLLPQLQQTPTTSPFEVIAAGVPRPLHAPRIKDRLPEIPVTLHLQLSCFHGGGESAGPRFGAKTPTGSGIGAWVLFGVEGGGNLRDLGSMGEDMVG
ncbi:hypothetical protein ACFX1R_031715 [Malus domestica]